MAQLAGQARLCRRQQHLHTCAISIIHVLHMSCGAPRHLSPDARQRPGMSAAWTSALPHSPPRCHHASLHDPSCSAHMSGYTHESIMSIRICGGRWDPRGRENGAGVAASEDEREPQAVPACEKPPRSGAREGHKHAKGPILNLRPFMSQQFAACAPAVVGPIMMTPFAMTRAAFVQHHTVSHQRKQNNAGPRRCIPLRRKR
jgi:hypothetical protein